MLGEPEPWGDLARDPENEQSPGVVVLRVDAGLCFANADHVRSVIRDAAARRVHAVVLDAETTPFLDVTAAETLAGLADDRQREGVQPLLTRDVGQIRDLQRRRGGAGRPWRVPDGVGRGRGGRSFPAGDARSPGAGRPSRTIRQLGAAR